MNCYIGITSKNKAKNDIDSLMKSMGFVDLAVLEGKNTIARFFGKLFSMFNLFFKLHKGDVLLIQYPFKKFYVTQCKIAKLKGAKTVTLIHDLGTFRRHKLTAEQEIERLSHTNFIVVHNDSMKNWLLEQGCKVPMYSLEIFDYLSDANPIQRQASDCHKHIVYAGGLGERKNTFLYDLDSLIMGCDLDLYGKGDLNTTLPWKNIHFKGFKKSDDFITNAGGDWGLVWDGDSVSECSGNWGEYLRINNPHKASFYLRAGMPVIVWKESAMAKFIIENNIGIAVDTLAELPVRLASVSNEDYAEMKTAVMQFKDKLASGYFFKKAFDEAVKLI